MAKVLLLAASGLARETLESIRQTGDHQVLGILDDNAALHGTSVNGVPVLGGLDLAVRRSEKLLLCAGKGASRAAIARRLDLPEERYATHISAHAVLGGSVSVGAGSIILAGTVATSDVRIGRHVVLMPRVVLTHDDVLEDFATLAAGATLAGTVHVGSEAYLGTNSTVRENLRIGRGAVLGMAAALITDLPAGQTWAGNPARPLDSRIPGRNPEPTNNTLLNASLKEATR
ncbi:acetyltransferase [Glutamicibacter soli]|uniref:Acetyltransferase n=1 Tax=Glutamicibacter soli TaxID=453836 RepID=A0A365YAD7_9MICC|nr:NeuD/PglB/VioB family sugar acetyltransferase [Glutamicibacter soli]RBL99660.1 acetyltransferase [Glutamicibacter soli]